MLRGFCLHVAAQPGFGRTPRGESYSVIQDKKHTLRGVFFILNGWG